MIDPGHILGVVVQIRRAKKFQVVVSIRDQHNKLRPRLNQRYLLLFLLCIRHSISCMPLVLEKFYCMYNIHLNEQETINI